MAKLKSRELDLVQNKNKTNNNKEKKQINIQSAVITFLSISVVSTKERETIAHNSVQAVST